MISLSPISPRPFDAGQQLFPDIAEQPQSFIPRHVILRSSPLSSATEVAMQAMPAADLTHHDFLEAALWSTVRDSWCPFVDKRSLCRAALPLETQEASSITSRFCEAHALIPHWVPARQ